MTPKRILVAYSRWSTYVLTTLEYLKALKRFTNYQVHFVHVTHDAQMNFDMNDYDVVFQNYCVRLCFDGYVSSHYQQALLNFRGLKILAVQDDYDRTATLHRAIRRLGFHVLLTCIQKEFWPLVYPQCELPGLKVIQGLTGYVPEGLLSRRYDATPLAERNVMVAYRGRDIGARYGSLGFEKYEIGRRMKEVCEARGICHDIAMDDSSRIYGEPWFDFLGASRTVLGSESGSNVFDFDGNIEGEARTFIATHHRPPTYQEFKHVLDPIEAPFNVGQISPRVFECTMMRTPMILFRGRYSDAIEAGVHYIPLEKDFSNIDEVLSKLDDLEALQGFSDRAYERLVQSGRFGYRSLAILLEDAIEEQYPIWVDREWVDYRAKTGMHWTPYEIEKSPSTLEEVHQLVLTEFPTEEPGTLAEAEDRQTQLVSALSSFNATIQCELIEPRRRSALRAAWRLLPVPMRYRIADRFAALLGPR